jgi:hypothetical protein
MKPLLITLALGLIMASTAQADLYRIRNTHSLEGRGMLVNLQPGAVDEE